MCIRDSDAAVLEETERITEALGELVKAVAAGEEGVVSASGNIWSAVTAAHNHFSKRIHYIKGFGD